VIGFTQLQQYHEPGAPVVVVHWVAQLVQAKGPAMDVAVAVQSVRSSAGQDVPGQR
jgi:hypothetical protein